MIDPEESKARAYWETNRKQILKDWIRTAPGTRPPAWWKYDVPEMARQRIAGTGDPAWEHLGYVLSYRLGIPDLWVSEFDTQYYNGKARHVDGHIIPTDYKDGDFTGKAVDPNDPPTYESQASYLRRLELFAPGEERRLPVDAFEPETITIEEEKLNEFEAMQTPATLH